MRRVRLLAALLLLPAPALADAEEDRRVCVDAARVAADRVAACTRLIEDRDISDGDVAELLAARGNARAALGEVEAAQADLAAAAVATAEIHYLRGIRAMSGSRYDEAVAEFEIAATLDPQPFYRDRLGVAYLQIGRHAEAMAVFDALLAEYPSSRLNWYFWRGSARLGLEQFDAAIADLTEALAREPLSALAYEKRGQAHQGVGNVAEAVRDIRIAMLLEPTLVDTDRLDELARTEPTPDRTALAFAPPVDGLAITYIEVVNHEAKTAMEDAMCALIAWFVIDACGPPSLPLEVGVLRRTISATERDVSTVTVTGVFDTQTPAAAAVEHFRVVWPLRLPGLPPDVSVAYDSATEAFWTMEPGGRTAGRGDALLSCPTSPNPLLTMLGCLPGATAARLGGVNWSAAFDGWEYVVVPAGRRLAARVTYEETRELLLMGRQTIENSRTVLWLDAELNWWIRREDTRDGLTRTAEAWFIDVPDTR